MFVEEKHLTAFRAKNKNLSVKVNYHLSFKEDVFDLGRIPRAECELGVLIPISSR